MQRGFEMSRRVSFVSAASAAVVLSCWWSAGAEADCGEAFEAPTGFAVSRGSCPSGSDPLCYYYGTAAYSCDDGSLLTYSECADALVGYEQACAPTPPACAPAGGGCESLSTCSASCCAEGRCYDHSTPGGAVSGFAVGGILSHVFRQWNHAANVFDVRSCDGAVNAVLS